MKVVGLLSWYDEHPDWLADAIAAIAIVTDHLVAVDGAYGLYPGGRPWSSQDQADAIRDITAGLGLGLTLHHPQTTWAGNEVEKRATMFALAEAFTTEEDWYLVIDGDEIAEFPPDFLARLETTPHDVGEVTFWERQEGPPPTFDYTHFPRILFRAVRGLTVDTKHYRYVLPDGRQMWGDGPCETAEDFKDVRIEHKTKYREPERRAAAKGYYDLRDQRNIECLFPSRPQLA